MVGHFERLVFGNVMSRLSVVSEMRVKPSQDAFPVIHLIGHTPHAVRVVLPVVTHVLHGFPETPECGERFLSQMCRRVDVAATVEEQERRRHPIEEEVG